MNNLLEINKVWSKLTEDERNEFINSKFINHNDSNVSLESISGTEKFTMHFGSVNVCSKCGKPL